MSTTAFAQPNTLTNEEKQHETPKNILLIMADDSAADNYDCYGSTFFKTPRLEVIWAQNQLFKLYRDGTLYAVADRHETTPIFHTEENQDAEDARKLLQEALDFMPDKAAKLSVKIK